MKKNNSYPIAILAVILLVLVFGITLTSGANRGQKESRKQISDLELKILTIENRLLKIAKEKGQLESRLEKKVSQVSKLKKELEELVRKSQRKGSLVSPANLLTQLSDESVPATKLTKLAKSKQEPQKFYTTLEIGGFSTFKIEFSSSQTALSQLISASQKHNFTIKTTQYDFGVFVDCIGEICGDTNHFWALYYNGEMSMIGAADLILKVDDKVSWVYSSF